MSDNPYAGPSTFVSLKNVLEHPKHAGFYQKPPRTGGTQLSLRLDERMLAYISAIVFQSGWNRSEVVYSLIERGLFDLFELLEPQISSGLIEAAQQTLCPPHPPAKFPKGNKQK